MTNAGRPSERLRDADREAREVVRRARQAAQDWNDANLAKGGVCDFCARPLVEGDWTLWRCDDAIMAEMSYLDHDTLGTATLPMGFDPEWVACSVCDKVVATRDPAALAAHAIAYRDPALRKILYEEEARASLALLYEQFFKLNPHRAETT